MGQIVIVSAFCLRNTIPEMRSKSPHISPVFVFKCLYVPGVLHNVCVRWSCTLEVPDNLDITFKRQSHTVGTFVIFPTITFSVPFDDSCSG